MKHLLEDIRQRGVDFDVPRLYVVDGSKALDAAVRKTYAMREPADAKRALEALWRELMDLNPSAARSLEEGMEQTITVHQLRVPEKLRRTLRTTNPIESAFDTQG